jgi:Tfp pilus assembly pilus retraction ATPase PilT
MQVGQEKVGMQTANQALARLYASGQITLETALSASARRDELQDLLGRRTGGAGRMSGG